MNEEKDNQNQTSQSLGSYVVKPKNKKIGLILLAGPFVGIVLILIFYIIINFIVAEMGIATETESLGQAIMNIIQLILSFLGIICILGIFIGIPLGIIYLNKKELIESASYDERSGEKKRSIVPDEIKGWNWGAAGLNWIWGAYHGVWISFLAFIPVVNIIVIILLGLKGSEWAWKASKWESVEEFQKLQNKWKPWGIVFFVLYVLGIVFYAFAPVDKNADFYNSQPIEVQKQLDDIKNNLNEESILSEDNINRYINLMASQGINITDRKKLKEGIQAGLDDGKKLNNFNEIVLSDIDFGVGYGVGYPVGCMSVGNSELFCRNLINEQLK